ncbi:MAG: glycoside hydrolase family 20 [Lacunisphaera sp.]
MNRLHQLVAKHDLQLGMWADMLYFVPAAIPLLPRGIVAYDWYYYPFARKPRVEFFNFSERDLQPALKRQGIQYYGCPMNGAFRYEPLPVYGDRLGNIRSWWQRCRAVKADGLLLTSWEAYRLALETTTVVDAAAANLWLEPDHDDATAMLTRGLERVFGSEPAGRQARALIAADEHAFAGYARWQINDRWDAFAGTESLKPYQNEERFFHRLQAGSYRWPAPLAVSLAFRLYLAQRDVFVRSAARRVFKCRNLLAKDRPGELRQELAALRTMAGQFARDLRSGMRAARAMWRGTRDPGRTGQNEALLARDASRLKEWRQWLAAAWRKPALVTATTPVCGPWQLQFLVHHVAPAVQKVVVEQQEADGTWRELASRHTIEFRASAARPASRLRREFTTPVNSPAASLRIAVRGVGRVAISHAMLTDGVTTHRARDYRRRIILGRPAPARGLPQFDWARNEDALPLAFD